MMPEMIGRYRIKGELGRGGMSTVYLAHDPHFERDVAIKLLPLELLHQSTFRRRFEREAKVVAALDHPAIVPVYDFGEEEKQPFLVMRFMTSGSLSDRLKQGALTIKEASQIVGRLALALDEVHAHGVIHRDLKPSNILFDQRNDAYISDFGTAKLSQAQTRLTETGGAVGTPAYMSPEQIQGNVELDGRSDIYSLGVILFEMLTGRHPYETDTPIGVAVKHIFEPVPQILEMAPDLPAECQEVIAQAMAKKRADRFVTAAAFANALNQVANKIETKSLRALPDPKSNGQGRRLALLINNSVYKDPVLAQLVKPAADLTQLAGLLSDPQIGYFDEVNLLTNETTNTIRRAISLFLADKQPDDLLLLYYTGHAAIGARSRLYLTAVDTEHDLLRGTAIPAAFIADEMDSSQSRQQVLILDCHFSNAISTDLPSLVGQAVNSGATFSRHGRERIVLTATDSTQYSWSKNQVRGQAGPSRFTHYLIRGLQTGAADANQDGIITIDELFAYVYDRLAQESGDGQTQVPRKWTPYPPQEETNLIIGYSQVVQANGAQPEKQGAAPGKVKSLPASTNTQTFMKAARQQRYVRWGALLAGLLALVWLFMGLSNWSGAQPTPTPDQGEVAGLAARRTSTPQPATPTTTAVLPVTPAATTRAPATSTPSPTAAAQPTATETAVSPTTEPTLITMALASSTVFAAPSANAAELAYVDAGEEVIILGRSLLGEWLYVRTADDVFGYIHGPRFDWDGDYDTLPIVRIAGTTHPTATATTAAACRPGACPPLTLDIYPLPGTRCNNATNLRYRTLFMLGNGGDGVYTYYWNNQRVAGPLVGEGHGFEISSNHSGPIIGQGKVVSGDGQSAEKQLFVSNFNCSD